MANLLIEYCRRHNCEYVLPTNAGLCFFNDYKRPAMIALTSVNAKSFQCCYNCGNDNSVILELFHPHRDASFCCIYHDHITPDEDILKIARNKEPRLSPVYLKHNREIELWLWNFFLFYSRLRRSKNWPTWEEFQTSPDPLKTYEQMAYCASTFQKTFAKYYSMYQTFVVGRKYLLFE